jgi:hypothetical protein
MMVFQLVGLVGALLFVASMISGRPSSPSR